MGDFIYYYYQVGYFLVLKISAFCLEVRKLTANQEMLGARIGRCLYGHFVFNSLLK